MPAMSHATPNKRTVSLAELFRGFATIGVLGFGGVAVMARHVIVEKYQWLSEKEYATVLGMGQVLPGANVVNASVIIGDRFQGLKGSIVSVLAIMTLPIMILLVLALLYNRFAGIPAVSIALSGAGAAAAGMVIATGLKMAIKLKPSLAGWLIIGLAIAGILVVRLPLVYTVLALIPTALVLTFFLRKK
jgi:chromate transporter